VEDDHRVSAVMISMLQRRGYEVEHAATATAALEAAPCDLVLLDLNLPDGDGVDVCRALLVEQPALPIIILTARDTEIDVVVGLDSGAVDYVTKPFRLAELSARVRTHLRRIGPGSEKIVVGELVVDRRARRAVVAGSAVELRAKEFDLLACLAAAAGNVLRREDLMAEIWDEHWFGSTKTLDFHVAALRRKIDEPDEPSRITTLRGVGYRYET